MDARSLAFDSALQELATLFHRIALLQFAPQALADDAERQRLDAERAATRKGQVGSGDRSERIRTYHFLQNRVTEHRIGLTTYNLPQVMEGEFEAIIAALQKAEFEEKLAILTGAPLPDRRQRAADDE